VISIDNIIAIMHTNTYYNSVKRWDCSLSSTADVTCSTSSFYYMYNLYCNCPVITVEEWEQYYMISTS